MKMTKMDRLTAVFAAALVIMSLFAAVGPFVKQSAGVRENTLRLHIVANSDDADDQRLKLAVRDEILTVYGEAFSAGKSIDDAVYVTEKLIDDIALTAQTALSREGCADGIKASVEEMYFETADYDGETMPAGNYKALRIVIGDGKGHNWWCVMYPSLCIPTVSKPEDSEDLSRIEALNADTNVKAKFAVVELIEKVKEVFGRRGFSSR